MPTHEELNRKFKTASNSEECAIWNGKTKPDGYGYVHIHFTYLVHRLAMEWKEGRLLLRDEQVKHLCENKGCYNPNHLFIKRVQQREEPTAVTPKTKQASLRAAKLTEQQVREIRGLLREGRSAEEIAGYYNISPGNVRYIKNRTSWGWVEDED